MASIDLDMEVRYRSSLRRSSAMENGTFLDESMLQTFTELMEKEVVNVEEEKDHGVVAPPENPSLPRGTSFRKKKKINTFFYVSVALGCLVGAIALVVGNVSSGTGFFPSRSNEVNKNMIVMENSEVCKFIRRLE